MNTTQSASTFAIIGVAGYVAARHVEAIKAVNGELRAAVDPADSVGMLDRFFPDTNFFVEFERFDRYIDKLRRQGQAVNYISICSPNYLHDAHVRFALRSDADAICEKPLVLNPWNVDALAEMERSTNRKVNTVLQLRLHPTIVALHEEFNNGREKKIHDVDLTYITSRGRWYQVSWKGDEQKSGGLTTNIGIHFYDILSYLFGKVKQSVVHHRASDVAAGYLEYDKARVRWFLSINRADLPANFPSNKTTYRSIIIDGREIELSDGFTDLHTLSYQEILKDRGFGIDQVRPSIETVAQIRSARLEPNKGEQHPLLESALSNRGSNAAAQN